MDRKIIATDHAPAAIGTYSQAVMAGDTLYLSGQIPLDPNTMQLVDSDFRGQCERVFRNLQAVLETAGADFGNVVKLTIYLTDMAHFGTVNEVMGTFFAEPYPARAAIGVKELPKGAQVEMDAIAVID